MTQACLGQPTTQIPVVEDHGRLVRMLDAGWQDFMAAAQARADGLDRDSRAQGEQRCRRRPACDSGARRTRVASEEVAILNLLRDKPIASATVSVSANAAAGGPGWRRTLI